MANPTLTGSGPVPGPGPGAGRPADRPAPRAAVVRANASRSTAIRANVRTQWLVLAAALTVLAGLLVAWGLSRAADRVDVVAVARPVAAGSVLTAADLTTTAVAFDGTAPGLVPAASLDELIGRATTIDLQPGTLLTLGMWADAAALAANERLVGAVLKPGRHPAALAQGMSALALSLDDDQAGVTVRVLTVAAAETGGLSITLAVADVDATRIARLGANERLVLIGLPASTVTAANASTVTAANATPSASASTVP